MKKGFILILAGIIPLLFVVYFFAFLNKDVRNSEFESATLLSSENWSQIKTGDLVKLSGILSPNNELRFKSYALATKELKVKQRDRSVWQTEEAFIGDLLVLIGEKKYEVVIKLANDYVPCGQSVKIESISPDKKSRILGVELNMPITGYGKVLTVEPLIVNMGNSPCFETLDEYTASLHKKFPSYLMAILFLAIPSFFLIYLGIYSNREESLREKT